MQNLASALIKNGPHPANQILNAYLKTTGMCCGAGLETKLCSTPSLQELSLTPLVFFIFCLRVKVEVKFLVFIHRW